MPVTVDVGGKALGISSGKTHTCALLEGGVAQCWGSNQFGQLGDSAQIISTDPVLIPEMASSTTVQAGLLHTCAIAQSGGGIKCVGSNRLGQLGDGTKVSAEKPVDVVGISGANEVTAGNSHTCALLAGGSVKCWGENGLGQLGDGTTTSTSTPVAVLLGITTASSTSAGGEHVCALLTDGAIWCWGGNSSGQLGNNSAADAKNPVPVDSISEGKAVSAGDFHTCAIVTSAKTVQCWGDNANGQLGDGGLTTSSAVPVDVMDITGVDEISLGRVHTCARIGVIVKCWGDNSKGQLGDGGNVPSAVPVVVSGISTAIRITTGNDYSCAILLDGTVQCWGENESGQLGNGTTINANTPVESNPLLAAATVVTAGQGHTCARIVDNRVQCWGDASYSQIGDQVILIEVSPVDVTGL
jgi:alpha-tubulin suppressor-like RCC1 family protein